MEHLQEPCPPWCVAHVNGAHVGEMNGPDVPIADDKGGGAWHVAAGPRRDPDGTVAVDLAVVQDGGEIRRLTFPIAAADQGEL